MGGTPERDRLRDHLVRTGIAGDVATPRENNLRHYRGLSERNPAAMFGLEPDGAWSQGQVLALMARRCGVDPDPGHRRGPDTIDPDLTLDALDAYADRLAVAAARREHVIVATGHPKALLAVQRAIARALRGAGCTLLRPAEGRAYRTPPTEGGEIRRIVYQGQVAVVADEDGTLRHTHSARPVRIMLGALADAGERLPDLVVADHGWAGGAGQAGIAAIGVADSNDPALFVGAEEGRVEVVVPMDDGLDPRVYRPLVAYVLNRAGLAG